MLPVQWKVLDLCTVPKWRNWQTRVVQVHVLARVWGFESLLRHQQSRKASNRLNKFKPCKHLQGAYVLGCRAGLINARCILDGIGSSEILDGTVGRRCNG